MLARTIRLPGRADLVGRQPLDRRLGADRHEGRASRPSRAACRDAGPRARTSGIAGERSRSGPGVARRASP